MYILADIIETVIKNIYIETNTTFEKKIKLNFFFFFLLKKSNTYQNICIVYKL